MKNILVYLILTITLIACGESEPEKPINYKFKLGDIAYLKIDSSRVIITNRYVWDNGNRYNFKYRGEDNDYEEGYAYEWEFYSKEIEY